MFNIEWTVNAYTIAVVIFVIGGFYFVTKSDMKVMKENVVAIKGGLEKLTELMVAVAVQKTEIEHLRNQIADQAAHIAKLEDRIRDLSSRSGGSEQRR